MKAEKDIKQQYYQCICNFQKYFKKNKIEKEKTFINDLKNNIEVYIRGKKMDLINGEGHRLYANSSSYIYYPTTNYEVDEKCPNVLLITHELSRTGAPVVCVDTAKILAKNGFFVTVISLTDGPLLKELLDAGISVIVMKTMKDLQYFRQDIENFIDYLDLDPFVENFDTTLMVTATLYNYVKRYFNTDNRILWWIHEGSESYNFLAEKMPKNLSPNIKVICGGEYAANQLEKNYFNYNPEVLNYGVEDVYNNISKTKRKKSKTKSQIVKFILAGSIGKRKGQLVLLEAIKKLPLNIREQAEFIFIGDYYKDDFEGKDICRQLTKYAEKNKNIIVLSSVSREELYRMYYDIDVIVLASIDDPMPVVATENLMLENICLCSDNTGTSYYIKDKENGFIFKTGDSEELANKITYIIENRDDLDKIKKKGRKIYEDYFEMSIFEKKIIDLVSGEENI